MRTFWILLAMALVVGWGMAMSLPRGGAATGPAPQFELAALDGTVVSLAELRGRVVLIDFWASWCAPCVTTFPEVQALAARHADEGLVLLVIDLDGVPDRARTYMAEHGFPLGSVLYGSLEAARAVKGLYNVWGIPHTVLIDRDGLIRYSGHPARLGEQDVVPWL
ncbi:MAG: TlpA disulfide reductase family protein [Candidatus Bipolaricaulis sp.]|nr:TlpA disulfide reductase family protein [Candidatus Bipolaricaulis sp.]